MITTYTSVDITTDGDIIQIRDPLPNAQTEFFGYCVHNPIHDILVFGDDMRLKIELGISHGSQTLARTFNRLG